MRPSRFSDQDIARTLEEVRAGATAASVCRRLGITQTTFYRWRAMERATPSVQARRIAELLDENARLKEIVADLLLAKRR